MSAPSDSYDPIEVAILTPEALAEAVMAAEKAFGEAADLDALARLRPAHLGDPVPDEIELHGERPLSKKEEMPTPGRGLRSVSYAPAPGLPAPPPGGT